MGWAYYEVVSAMLRIALTGGIGSGKTTVANLFAGHGIDIIDTDVIAREVVMPGTKALKQLIDYFGPQILNSQGELDRRQLGQIIFHDSEKKNDLEQLLHPLIREEMTQAMAQSQSPYCIAVIPLLIENKSSHHYDRILVIDCEEDQQISRTLNRDNRDRNTVEAIITQQASREQRLDVADDIIVNHDNLSALQDKVHKLHQFYLTQV